MNSYTLVNAPSSSWVYVLYVVLHINGQEIYTRDTLLAKEGCERAAAYYNARGVLAECIKELQRIKL